MNSDPLLRILRVENNDVKIRLGDDAIDRLSTSEGG
jgi:hypothetical protein